MNSTRKIILSHNFIGTVLVYLVLSSMLLIHPIASTKISGQNGLTQHPYYHFNRNGNHNTFLSRNDYQALQLQNQFYLQRRQHESSFSLERDEDDLETQVDKFLEVMGPGLFPLPFFLFLLPFAIPALPLILNYKETENHHESKPEGEKIKNTR